LAARSTHDRTDSLALAVIASSTAPLLLLDDQLAIVAVSRSFCRAFHIDSEQAVGRTLFGLGAGEWDVPQLRSLLAGILSGDIQVDAYEMDLKPRAASRRLVINAQLLDYAYGWPVRLLVAVTDVDAARAEVKLKDEMLREKAVLLQEVRHRVANSLQIIASILMQNARKVQSEETRGHLQDAHHRVMSVAALEHQLATTTPGDVLLNSYFARLCDSIIASMIQDHDQLSLKVVSDGSTVDADVSVSLGLIVTELVINALKHAFPANRHGAISVDYSARGPNWTLSVSDDGVGMPDPSEGKKAGLGTSIVEALARQLQAQVKVTDMKPGTRVSIIHAQIAAVDDEPANIAAGAPI
jgi:two-component sensor histidine kinase